MHDACRKDPAGRGTNERAVAAVRRLQGHGVQPDLLCTVTAAIAQEPVAVYSALRALDTGWIQFIPIVNRATDGGVTPESVSSEGYGQFLCGAFDEWVRRDIGRLDVQQFAEILLVLAGGTANLCWMAPTCGRVLIVEQDGSIYSCDHFVTPEHRIGDLDTAHLSALVDTPVQRQFGANKRDRLPAQCRACQWLALCNGGCPKDRFAAAGSDQPLNHLCNGLRQFFAHAEQPLRQIVQLRKSGHTSEAIMAALVAESQARWKTVGRNDPCPCGSGRKAKNCCLPKGV